MVVSDTELAKHNTPEDCWVAIDGKVYDVTKFLSQHPGGEKVLYDLGGTDATKEFFELHRLDVLKKFGPKLFVGDLEGGKVLYNRPPEAISEILYAENPVWQGFNSPYYNESHLKFKKAIRKLAERFLGLKTESLANAGRLFSKKVWLELGSEGIHAAVVGPGHYIGKYTKAVGGVGADEFDYFHEMIAHIELYRVGAPGVSDGMSGGTCIGLPPIVHFKCRDPALTERVTREVIVGEKRICLAISEPWAGTDVANVQCTAVKSDCGGFYIVKGSKKWITGGLNADYFTTAVRTGPKSFSFLLIDRAFGGVQTKKIKTRYSSTAGTSLVIFKDVRVPVSHLIGKENDGFKMIMHNFNHERWAIACYNLGFCRRAIEECAKWMNQRIAFKKPLMKQPALRQKLADMIAKTEALQAYVDFITYQLCTMDYKRQNKILGGPICLLKLRAARVVQEVTDEAVQIFGGRGLTNTGMGQVVQRLRASNQYCGIYGGTNEALGDYAVRQMARKIPEWSRL